MLKRWSTSPSHKYWRCYVNNAVLNSFTVCNSDSGREEMLLRFLLRFLHLLSSFLLVLWFSPLHFLLILPNLFRLLSLLFWLVFALFFFFTLRFLFRSSLLFLLCFILILLIRFLLWYFFKLYQAFLIRFILRLLLRLLRSLPNWVKFKKRLERFLESQVIVLRIWHWQLAVRERSLSGKCLILVLFEAL